MINEVENLVCVDGDTLVTDSRLVAARFDKQHSKVMRAITSLIKDTGEWGVANFGETLHKDSQNGQTYRSYRMTKDGFMLLVMGFTGKKALDMKLKFISAFNTMASRIKEMEVMREGERQNLWLQMQALIAREVESHIRASFGSHLMLKRKEEKPRLQTEREMLEAAIQPSLLN